MALKNGTSLSRHIDLPLATMLSSAQDTGKCTPLEFQVRLSGEPGRYENLHTLGFLILHARGHIYPK
jgi:hypothetical protein